MGGGTRPGIELQTFVIGYKRIYESYMKLHCLFIVCFCASLAYRIINNAGQTLYYFIMWFRYHVLHLITNLLRPSPPYNPHNSNCINLHTRIGDNSWLNSSTLHGYIRKLWQQTTIDGPLSQLDIHFYPLDQLDIYQRCPLVYSLRGRVGIILTK